MVTGNVGNLWGYRYLIGRNKFRLSSHEEPQIAYYGRFATKEHCEVAYKEDLKRHAAIVASELRQLSDVKVLIKRLKKYQLDSHVIILEDIQAQLSKFEQSLNLLNK